MKAEKELESLFERDLVVLNSLLQSGYILSEIQHKHLFLRQSPIKLTVEEELLELSGTELLFINRSSILLLVEVHGKLCRLLLHLHSYLVLW